MASIPRNMTEQIDAVKNLEISYRMFHNSAALTDSSTKHVIEIPFESLLRNYKEVLSSIIITIQLDERLSQQYLYKPKLLSYDLYDTVELWAEILRLNNWSSISQFKPKKIKIYDPNKLKAFLNEILILEEKI